ncbi:MAG TPA: glycosyltransferase family 4 protein [Bacillota bacterium]|nr:glycosyltransferase family 4 protein [Bacillota bacterium]
MLRVLHIISDTNIGGAGRHLLAFLGHYDRERLAVYVLCPVRSALGEQCVKAGAETFFSPHLAGDRSFGWRGLSGLFREVRDLVREKRIDLVHTHASFSGRLAAVLTGVPVVYTKHRMDWEAPGCRLEKRAAAWLNRLTCRRVIAVSGAVRENLLAGGMPEEKIEVIYNGIDVEKFRAEALKDVAGGGPGAGGGFVVGMVARLEPEKGHRYFLEAAAQVLKKVENVSFMVVGAGSLADELAQKAGELGIGERVVFTGHRDEIAPLVAAMDVLVVPSLTEAFGLSLIEGMCLGRPCVASAVGGIKEIAGENGRAVFLVPPGDAAAIAEKVVFLLKNPEFARAMGRRAALEVEKRFSAGEMAEKITGLYYRMVKKRA